MPDILNKTDYAIIKELIKKPRIEVLDLSKATSFSPKTIRKRIEKMKRNRVLEFSINVNPSAMRGQIIFFLSVTAEMQFYPRLLERILGELQDNIILSFNFANQVNAIGLNLAIDDVFKIEKIRARIESFDGVQEANVFFPIKLECPQEWVIRMIDHRLKKEIQLLKKYRRNYRFRSMLVVTLLLLFSTGFFDFLGSVSLGSVSSPIIQPNQSVTTLGLGDPTSSQPFSKFFCQRI